MELYKDITEIGRGSFATVFKAIGPSRTPVAIKIVNRSKLNRKLIDNLESEIKILTKTRHPNVVLLIEVIKTTQEISLVMEFCDLGDLSLFIKKKGRVNGMDQSYPLQGEWGGLDDLVVKYLLAQLTSAIKFLRFNLIIHRDLKPQNILLSTPNQQFVNSEVSEDLQARLSILPILKLGDFGFARGLESQSMASTLCGSPLYMAPEILKGEKYDAKTDLWSIGAILFEMIVGKPPFRAQNHIELLRRIEKSTVTFPDEGFQTKIPDGLKALIELLLKRNPVERVGFEEFFMHSSVVECRKLLPTQDFVRREMSKSQSSLGSSVGSIEFSSEEAEKKEPEKGKEEEEYVVVEKGTEEAAAVDIKPSTWSKPFQTITKALSSSLIYASSPLSGNSFKASSPILEKPKARLFGSLRSLSYIPVPVIDQTLLTNALPFKIDTSPLNAVDRKPIQDILIYTARAYCISSLVDSFDRDLEVTQRGIEYEIRCGEVLNLIIFALGLYQLSIELTKQACLTNLDNRDDLFRKLVAKLTSFNQSQFDLYLDKAEDLTESSNSRPSTQIIYETAVTTAKRGAREEIERRGYVGYYKTSMLLLQSLIMPRWDDSCERVEGEDLVDVMALLDQLAVRITRE